MALFDVFTGGSVDEAAAQQRAMLEATQGKVSDIYSTGRTGGLASLESARTGGLDALTAAILQGRGDIGGTLDPAIAALYGGTGGASTALQAGQTGGLLALGGGVAGASSAYDPLAAAASRYGLYGDLSGGMAADALGLGGPEGYARAQQAFTASPGYQFQLGQGIDALTRAANAGGMLASGNTLQEAQRFGQGLAGTEFNNWLKNLAQQQGIYVPAERGALTDTAAGRAQAALTGGTGGANIFTGTAGRLSDLLSGTGSGAANLYSTSGRSLADLALRGGTGLADIYGTTGAREADLYRALATGEAGTIGGLGSQAAQSYMDAAQAEMQGSANAWNAIGNTIKGATSLAGSGGLSGLTSFFSPTPSAPMVGSRVWQPAPYA